ncbi:MAG TPA: hypothetical protein VIF15_22360 [Polyangiaceae bacterium]|jgi:hypothetical protein
MADSSKPPDAAYAPLGSPEELRGVWDRFRAGEVVPCPADGAPLALAVDAAAGAYRFVCTKCGVASSWFESGPSGIHIRGYSPPGSSRGAADE